MSRVYDFGRVETTGGQAGGVDDGQSARQLDDVAPDRRFGQHTASAAITHNGGIYDDFFYSEVYSANRICQGLKN